MYCTQSVTNRTMVQYFDVSNNTVPSNTVYVNFIVCKYSLHFNNGAGICNSTLNMVFRSSHCEHWYWIHQSSGSSLSMSNSNMKWFSFLVIILGFTSRKSLAGLVVGSSSKKYGESSNVRNAVSFFFTIFSYFKYNVTPVSNFFGIIIILNPYFILKMLKNLSTAGYSSYVLWIEYCT